MDNNEFNVFIEEYEKHFDIISNCKNLQKLNDAYSAYIVS